MRIRTATLLAACVAAAALVRPALAQTETAAAGAAATPAAATAPAAAPAARPRRNPNLITRAEMEERGARNVMDGVRSLRASWLRASRMLSSSTDKQPEVVVYRDGALAGNTNALRDIAVESVATVQYLPPSQAVQRFGNDASAGAILVSTGAH